MTLKDLLDAVATLGALGFALAVVWGYFTGRIPGPKYVQYLLDTIEYERGEKVKAQEFADATGRSHDKMADAIDERNRLDRERLMLSRHGQFERHDDV